MAGHPPCAIFRKVPHIIVQRGSTLHISTRSDPKSLRKLCAVWGCPQSQRLYKVVRHESCRSRLQTLFLNTLHNSILQCTVQPGAYLPGDLRRLFAAWWRSGPSQNNINCAKISARSWYFGDVVNHCFMLPGIGRGISHALIILLSRLHNHGLTCYVIAWIIKLFWRGAPKKDEVTGSMLRVITCFFFLAYLIRKIQPIFLQGSCLRVQMQKNIS